MSIESIGSHLAPERRCPHCNAPEGVLRKGGADGGDRLCTACRGRWRAEDEVAIRVGKQMTNPTPTTDPIEDAVNTAAEATDPDNENAEGWERL